MNTRRYDHLFKIVVVGSLGVGKSSLQIRYLDDTFDVLPINMIGTDFRTKLIQLDGKIIKLQIWDTNGSQRFLRIYVGQCLCRDAHGVLLVYDVTDQRSFDDISMWSDMINIGSQKGIVKLLVGNKCDLTSQKIVEYDTAKSFADQHGLELLETSARDGFNVEQAFIRLAAKIKIKMDLTSPSEKSCMETARTERDDCKCHIS